MASDPVVDVILIFYPDKDVPLPTSMMSFSHMIWVFEVVDVDGIVCVGWNNGSDGNIIEAGTEARKPQWLP